MAFIPIAYLLLVAGCHAEYAEAEQNVLRCVRGPAARMYTRLAPYKKRFKIICCVRRKRYVRQVEFMKFGKHTFFEETTHVDALVPLAILSKPRVQIPDVQSFSKREEPSILVLLFLVVFLVFLFLVVFLVFLFLVVFLVLLFLIVFMTVVDKFRDDVCPRPLAAENVDIDFVHLKRIHEETFQVVKKSTSSAT
jgi:hypothetical protein